MSNEDAQKPNIIWEDLVVSILAVNRYSIEKSYSLLEGLRKQGLVDPHNLNNWGPSELARRLCEAGFDRGEFMTNLFAVRLSALGNYINKKGVEHSQQVLLSNNKESIEKYLKPVEGIGPIVLRNFFILRDA